jgi:hypothetical protein
MNGHTEAFKISVTDLQAILEGMEKIIRPVAFLTMRMLS